MRDWLRLLPRVIVDSVDGRAGALFRYRFQDLRSVEMAHLPD